jgi:hypothetical protein
LQASKAVRSTRSTESLAYLKSATGFRSLRTQTDRCRRRRQWIAGGLD